MGLAGLCHRPFGEGCTAQNAGFASVARRQRCAQTSPSSCWARLMFARQQLHGPVRALRTTECQDNHSAAGTLCVLASLPQPDLEVRSLRNAARQYPCARPFVLSPRAAKLSVRPAEHLFAPGLEFGPGLPLRVFRILRHAIADLK